MAPKRRGAMARPAAAVVPRLRRPAARVEPAVPEWKKLGELGPAAIGKLGHVWLHEALYYGRQVEVAGKIDHLRYERGDVYVDLIISGTKDDELLRVMSGRGDRILAVHLCDAGCQHVMTGEALIHAEKYQEVDKTKEAWFTNLEVVGPAPAREDEMARLREAALKAEEDKDRGDRRSPKRKRSKSKKRKKEKAKEKKEKKGSKQDDKDGSQEESEEESDLGVIGQKDPSVLFKGTGLDPERKRREKIARRARRLGKSGKKKKKKKKDDSREDKGESSSSSSGDTLDDEGGAGLFQPDRKVKLISDRCPGALTFAAMMEAREHLVTQSGTAWAIDRNQLSPLFVHFTRQGMANHMPPAMLQEAITIATVLDSLLLGRAAAACDALSQRLKALECLSRGSHWTVARQLEIVRTDGMQLSQDTETLEAARRAREEEKLKNLVNRNLALKMGDGDYSARGRGRGRGGKGAPRGRGDDSGRGRGDGRRDDKAPWQKDKKDKWKRERSSQHLSQRAPKYEKKPLPKREAD